MPRHILDQLQSSGISVSPNFDPEEHEQHRCDTLNATPGHLEGYDCPFCLNRGHIYIRKDGHTTSRECSCMEIRRSIKRAQHSGLGKKLEDCTFERYETRELWQTKAKEKALAYAEDPAGWFVAAGKSGSGKTHLCTAICKVLLNKGRGVSYEMWRQSSQRIRAVAMDAEAKQKLMEPLIGADVLYIDDFLKTATGGTPTKADIELAFDIINARYNARATTILSTEWNIDGLLNLDEAMGSRIFEMTSRATLLTFSGDDKNWRLRRGSEG